MISRQTHLILYFEDGLERILSARASHASDVLSGCHGVDPVRRISPVTAEARNLEVIVMVPASQ